MNILHFFTEVTDILIQRFKQGLDIFLIGFCKFGTFLIEYLIGQILEFFLHLLGQFFLLHHLGFQFSIKFLIEGAFFHPLGI